MHKTVTESGHRCRKEKTKKIKRANMHEDLKKKSLLSALVTGLLMSEVEFLQPSAACM